MAFYFRKTRQFLSGASIGFSSLIEIHACPDGGHFCVGKKMEGLLRLPVDVDYLFSVGHDHDQTSLPRYLEENRTTTFALIHRPDNAALIVASHRFGGWLGLP